MALEDEERPRTRKPFLSLLGPALQIGARRLLVHIPATARVPILDLCENRQ
ncbi:MAG: hypothetical protein NTY35_12220 [Planctomycetota bacterium]|nr:hypothetical protein [Planctomycetota bacterium]